MKTVILTISDRCSRGEAKDLSGQVLKEMVETMNGTVEAYEIIADEIPLIKEKLIQYSQKKMNLILTTGGTGFGPRDVTPEATHAIAERHVPGLSELIRLEGMKKTKNAALSRGISVLRGGTLIINLPGSPKGAAESFKAVQDLIPHAFKMLKGESH